MYICIWSSLSLWSHDEINVEYIYSLALTHRTWEEQQWVPLIAHKCWASLWVCRHCQTSRAQWLLFQLALLSKSDYKRQTDSSHSLPLLHCLSSQVLTSGPMHVKPSQHLAGVSLCAWNIGLHHFMLCNIVTEIESCIFRHAAVAIMSHFKLSEVC